MTDKDIRYTITAEDRFARTFQTLKRDIAGAKDGFGAMAERASAVNLALGSLTLGAVGAGGIALGIRQLTRDLDALNDAADATGSSVENLSALENIARRNGESIEVVVAASLRLNKVLNDASPDSPMAQALQRIGLSAEQLRNDDPALAIQKVAVALAGYADDGNKARLVQELFGKSVREVGPFLKDLAEAGKLNATVTTEQAQQAEKFNKELAALSTNAGDAARSLVSKLLPALNGLFDDVRTGGLSKALGLDELQRNATQASTVYQTLSLMRQRITPLQILDRNPKNEQAIAELARIDGELKKLGASFKAVNAERLKLTDGSAGGGRGFVNPPVVRPSTPALAAVKPAAAAAGAPQVSEAERYLETLQKQAEKLQDLTTLQQLLKDIETRRIDGITPKLERELKIAAQKIDLQKELNKQKEMERDIQKLISDQQQSDINDALSLLQQTPSGQLQGLEIQANKLLDFSRRLPADDPRQQQVLEAMTQLNEKAKALANPVQDAKTGFESLADTIEKSMDRSTNALLDFALTGKGSINTVFESFGRDILRQLIEEPLRNSLKDVAKDIGSFAKTASATLTKLFEDIGNSSNSGGGWSGIFKTIGSFFGGGSGDGYMGRANGGPVSAGSLVRWQENGREWFVPNTDGTVVNQGQMRAMLGAGGGINQTNHITINGGDPQETQRLIDAALARNNAALVRSTRYGGKYAAG